MARKLRIVAIVAVAVAASVSAGLVAAYFAVQRVMPFYEEALQLDDDELKHGSRELESRATALYSDARKAGQWHAVFTAEQVNGWLAVQLGQGGAGELPDEIQQPRVAISPEAITLGFRTQFGGTETVVSVDADVFLTEADAIAIRLIGVRAGALPLPVMQVADEIATACHNLSIPVRWTQDEGQPVAIVEIRNDESPGGRQIFVDVIELGAGSVYVAGHTEIAEPDPTTGDEPPIEPTPFDQSTDLDGYQLRLSRGSEGAALEIARRPDASRFGGNSLQDAASTDR